MIQQARQVAQTLASVRTYADAFRLAKQSAPGSPASHLHWLAGQIYQQAKSAQTAPGWYRYGSGPVFWGRLVLWGEWAPLFGPRCWRWPRGSRAPLPDAKGAHDVA